MQKKCHRYEIYNFQKTQEREIRNEGIEKMLKDLGCDYCSGNYHECKGHVSKSDFYEGMGC